MIGNIFKAYDVRATYPDPLSEGAAWKVGYATGQFFYNRNGGRPGAVLVSRDMRPHSPGLAHALSDGIRAANMNVIDLGMCDTSFMYFAINHVDAVGGVQTTASHNPMNYNGFKISGDQAKPVGADTGLKEIQQIAESLDEHRRPTTGSFQEMDLWNDYRDHILSFLSPLTRKTKLFIDASNGMAGKLIPMVFDGVENLEIIPLNFEIGGEFAHEPNPLIAENMIPTQDGVKQHGADLGACFDGDADRCMLVDDRSELIGCDHLTALFCHHFLKIEPGANIVYDLRSSKVVEQTIRELGGRPNRSRVGHVFMKAVLRDKQAIFGGELSGHFYFRDNAFADSGAISLAVSLTVLNDHPGKTISQLIEPFRVYPQSGEINFEVEDKKGVMQSLKDKYGKKAAVDELDGVTIDAFDNLGWWINVRPSNTEPLLRLNAEAKDQATLDAILQELKPQLGKPAEGH